ncbi:hypothetical protein INT43_003217 [Umbelopsis isabellina]|uniref:TPX2 central domain-containing protein n=1 Tax=Mortierella isabellina TaxID=91625 RepID=A0A8H7PQC6_MORIS|nr:hypothetical protein INT43_003217 [Umbelopsis isabellina]
MLTAESDSHVHHRRMSSQRDEEMGSPRTSKNNGQTEHVHWDFDAPRYWDLDNPETGGGFDDTWFARRPLTPTAVSPASRPFSERKPRRSGVKGSPLRMIRTPPRAAQGQPDTQFQHLPATPLTSKSTSQYATPRTENTASQRESNDIPLSPFLNHDLLSSSTPNNQTSAIPTLPARATSMSTLRNHGYTEHDHEARGQKRSHAEEEHVWDDENKEFRPVIDTIKRRISTIVLKCTNRDISTPLRRRSMLRQTKRNAENDAEPEDEETQAALSMLKDAIRDAKESESMLLDHPVDVQHADYYHSSADIPTEDILPPNDTLLTDDTVEIVQEQPRDVVRGTDTSVYLKSPPITTDGERRYITLYLPPGQASPKRHTRPVQRTRQLSSTLIRRDETENPFDVNDVDNEQQESHKVNKSNTSARLASLNERLKKAQSSTGTPTRTSERPRSPYLRPKPTVASGPSLETSKRVKNPNTEERELEEARKHQFKAHPVNRRVLESRGHMGVPEAKSSSVTIPHSPTFHTLSRHSR